MIGAAEIAVAKQVALWDEERARWEFEKCRDWFEEHGKTSKRWDITWRKWCRKGREIDERDATQASQTGVRSAATGIKRWLDRQRD